MTVKPPGGVSLSNAPNPPPDLLPQPGVLKRKAETSQLGPPPKKTPKEALVGVADRNQERAKRKKKAEEDRALSRAKNKGVEQKTGRPRITLLDDLVIARMEPSNSGKLVQVVYCIECDKRSVGRAKDRILGHANSCDVSYCEHIFV